MPRKQNTNNENNDTPPITSPSENSVRTNRFRGFKVRRRGGKSTVTPTVVSENPNDIYPHSTHPALVPGVDIETQKVRYRVDVVVVSVIAVVLALFFAWGMLWPENMMSVSSAALSWVMANVGWVFNSLAIVIPAFLIYLAVSKYGRVPLGLDGEKPEYPTMSWAAMLFAAGIGIGIIFFGTLEPLTFYLSPRPGAADPATNEAVKHALAQAGLHWGICAWAFYALVGVGVGYASFRKGRVPLMSSILTPIFGGDSTKPSARLIDGLAIFTTLFGTAASLGLGALQIGKGVEIVSGWGTTGNTLAIMIIVVLSIGTLISAVSGVAKGIRRLSDVNLWLSIGLALFFFIGGPTMFLINIVPGVITEYFANMPGALGATMADGDDTVAFLSSWTTFYWAWWVSWAPFVGVFLAKISRGRTIRQVVAGVMLLPGSILITAFTILGGTAIWVQRETGDLAANNNVDNLPAPEEMLFAVLDHLPGGQIAGPIIMIMLAIFFITSADSASLVNSQMSQQGNPNPKRIVTVIWVIAMASIAIIMLLIGGSDALSALQNVVTVSAVPFAALLILMMVAMMKELKSDPLIIRGRFEKRALSDAVQHGIAQHGDNFEIQVNSVDSDSEWAAGREFDSTDEKYTEWYTRTDEDGNPVEYDYKQGTYVDPDTRQPITLEEVGSGSGSPSNADTAEATAKADGTGDDQTGGKA